ncbi:MAG TPA: glycoside hydrolase family 16 protein [Rariglobus sp.]|nr:glycoside hydrolase family 16 protein [Rariglobus sp.]
MSLVLLSLFFLSAGSVKAAPPAGNWTLTFEEEFTTFYGTTGLNPAKWQMGMRWVGVINEELQAYTPDNVIVDAAAGVCIIKPEKRTAVNIGYGGHTSSTEAYASGAFGTYNTWTQAYGYFEARVKMASSPGTWPAFWLMPDRGASVTPLDNRVGIGDRGGAVAFGNEIDIFEYMGTWKNQTTGMAKAKSGYFWQYNPNLASGVYTKVNQLANPDTQFHTYGVAWSPAKLEFYIDGDLVGTKYGRTSIGSCPHYLILNCAIAQWDFFNTVPIADIDAGLPGSPMVIDSVRAYSGTPAPVAIVNGIYETEAIVQATASDAQSVAYDTAASNGAFEGVEANAVGDYITYQVPVAQTGTYNVKVRFKRAALSTSNRGQFQLSVDGVNQGSVQDQYGSGIFVEVDLGNVTFGTAGNKAFKFTVTGKNASSAGYNLNFDYIKLTPVAAALPSPWVNQDVGSVGVAGSTTYASGTFTVNGSGTDIQGTADSFQYAYQAASGDCSITARVASQTNTHNGAKAGVMIRETLAADSPNMFMEVSPSFGLYYQYRTTAGGATTAVSSGAGTAPYWVRVTRVGNTFTAARSSDNVTWTTVTTTTIPMGTTVYIGLAKNSRVNTTLGTATFDNVTATP